MSRLPFTTIKPLGAGVGGRRIQSLFSRPLSLFVCAFLFVCLTLSVCLSVSLSLCLSVSVCVCLFLSILSACPCSFVSLFLSLCLSLCLSLSLSVCLTLSLSLPGSLSQSLSLPLSFSLSFSLSLSPSLSLCDAVDSDKGFQERKQKEKKIHFDAFFHQRYFTFPLT